MTVIRVFFSQIRAPFSNFWKRAGETFPPTPFSYMLGYVTSTHLILKRMWCISVKIISIDFLQLLLIKCTNITFISLIHFPLPFVLVFNFSFFAFFQGLAISFQFEFHKKCQKWKCQIILFDISIVSLDIALEDRSRLQNLISICFF